MKTEQGRGYRMLGPWTIRAQHEPPAPTANAPPPPAPPAIAPAHQPFASNLPAPASELIGRAAAVRQLRELLSAYRVVTLTGPGGIGKSVLALEVARDLRSGLQGDAWLVELVSLSDPALVPTTVAAVLGLKVGGSEVSAQSVARVIDGRKLLLVLDNCEHLVDAAAERSRKPSCGCVRAPQSSPPAGRRCGSTASAPGACRRWMFRRRTTMRRATCSTTAPCACSWRGSRPRNRSIREPISISAPSPRSAGASTAFRSRSSSPRHAPRRLGLSMCCRAWTIGSRC